MKKETICIEVLIRKKQTFNFQTEILGFNFFQINEWEHKVFEIEYIKGDRGQDSDMVIGIATKELFAQYGKKNIVFKSIYISIHETE
jgi:hypothetical protein